MAHANAMLTPKARLKLAQLVVEHHWTITEAAKHYMVSWPTAKRWVTRYLEHGREGMEDKSSRPLRSPNRTPRKLVKASLPCASGWAQYWSPGGWAFRLRTCTPSLVRSRVNRLRYIDRITGEPIRRYLGRVEGGKNSRTSAACSGYTRSSKHPRNGTAYVHTVLQRISLPLHRFGKPPARTSASPRDEPALQAPHRPGNKPPVSRLTNLPEQYT